ncbi:MAG: Flp pilus assembly complex ATPase component TadA [Rhodocyclaceae bacterium]|nr:Flp pilus assembly complex ATPase component TadA [Rhodocyclaceae bacterium]MBX3678241.1 Flp pilus assembly complex ATPase component TadA [Rhodocyclaceae bacterium]MCO5097726.1 Flp pilus assembly complex ATPase component TadA [Rhodocyclaceae bacterium]MCP5296869.1 Flp pilus assembly complex ATPase component TadA [Zoogloeaceae bacterium]MCW5596842.1 Flp pilus assembly complex ATPase component TadA [Rhodocyclaceae bacterium]
MNSPAPHRRPLGQILIAQGVISEDQLRIALLEQMKSNQPVGKLLVSLGFITEATLRDALGESLGKKSIDLSHAIVDPSALRLVPLELAKRHRLLPLDYDRTHHRMTVAISDVNDIVALDKLRSLTHDDLQIDTVLAGESEISRAIDQYYGHELSIDGILHEIETGEIDWRSLAASSDEYSQPVVRLIDAILTDAVKRDASDVHFEPEQNFLRIRYRIDGLLRQIRALHKSYWPAMAVRIKVVSNMNIAETRAPQDGRISLNISGRLVDFRVSAQPTIHGENVVLRILDRQKGIVPLDQIGLDDSQLDQLKLMIARPEGIVLVTGPTGSGKTTTLYSMLNHINEEGINIMTLEDPVEYPMSMIRQTSVAEAAKLDFANGVRSMMRQDPDVILVGEIRDADTAEMAFRAAMTGHQVYSTLHTNSAIGVVPRLLDIGVLPDIMAGNIIGVIAQRLVRKLCPHCKKPYQPEPHETRLLGLASDAPAPTLYRASGCEHCEYQGYRGRQAIMELLRLDADLDELIARRATMRDIKQAALAKGFRSLAEDGLRRVREGTTSLEEIGRVVDLTERM